MELASAFYGLKGMKSGKILVEDEVEISAEEKSLPSSYGLGSNWTSQMCGKHEP
jgi:hypothetical protein